MARPLPGISENEASGGLGGVLTRGGSVFLDPHLSMSKEQKVFCGIYSGSWIRKYAIYVWYI